MAYIIMAIQEEGSEARIADFDEHSRGFDSRETASNYLFEAYERYPEYRQIWVEELRDQSYWMNRAIREDWEAFGPDYEY